MLIDLEGRKKRDLPHADQYEKRVARLRPGLEGETLRLIDDYCSAHDQVTVAWLFAVRDVGDRHHEIAVALGEEQANELLGQMLWDVLRLRRDVWCFYRPEGEGLLPKGMRYWRTKPDD
jgi:hypothetical protein